MNFDSKNSLVLLTKKQVAERLQLSPRTIENLTNRGKIPKICLGKTVRYSPESIERFIRESTINLNPIGRKDDL